MGPRLNRRGKAAFERRDRPGTAGFNGATPQQAWKVWTLLVKGFVISGFNGATPQQAWKGRRSREKPSSSVALQWGHASTGVESGSTPSQVFVITWLQWGHASTGVERSITHNLPASTSLLQWGHASTGVERCVSVLWTRYRHVLQWGHASTGVERPGSEIRVPTELQCFNGATPQQAWKVCNAHSRRTSRDPLQWGHASTGVERCG